jgi:hypothetical protein
VRCFLLALGRETMAGMESIYSLIPQPVPPVIKPDRYYSKHPGNKPPTFSTFGLVGTSKPGYQNVAGAESSLKEGHHVFQKGHATMGKEGNARKPADILKKGTGGGGGAADLAGASTGGGAQGQQTFSLHTLVAWRARASAQSSRAGGRCTRGGGIAACAVAADPPDAHASHERTLRGCWAPLPLQTALPSLLTLLSFSFARHSCALVICCACRLHVQGPHASASALLGGVQAGARGDEAQGDQELHHVERGGEHPGGAEARGGGRGLAEEAALW